MAPAHPTPVFSRKVRWRRVLVVCVILGFAGWGVWRVLFAAKPAVATVQFADGARVEILAVVVGTKLTEGRMGPPTGVWISTEDSIRRYLRLPARKQEEGEGAGSGTTDGISHLYYCLKGETRARGIEITAKDSRFIMLLRGFEPDGHASRWEGSLHGGWLTHPPRSGPDRRTLADLPMLIEVWAGEKAGWIPVYGPDYPHKLDDRAYGYGSAFQRSSPTLRLRFTRRGQPPVETTIANPNPSQPESWMSETLPVTKRAGETDITLSGVDQERPKFGVTRNTLRLQIEPNPGQVSPDLDSVQDASGNSAIMGQGGGNQSFILPPGLGPWRARYTVRRSKDFPWPLSEMNVLLDGEFTAADQPLKLTPTAFFTSLGTLTLAGEANRHDSDKKEILQLHFNWHLQSPTVLPQVAQDLSENRWALFVDGNPVPTSHTYTKDGYVVRPKRPGAERAVETSAAVFATGNLGPTMMNMKTTWRGVMAPGTKFQVGVLKPTPPQKVEFTFDPSTAEFRDNRVKVVH
jgi:hypothetical protein